MWLVPIARIAKGNPETMVREALLPEEWLNLFILCEAVAYKAMSGLGTLATVWATVVLLGGFSTLVKQTDFWYITIIAFLQTIGYVHVSYIHIYMHHI